MVNTGAATTGGIRASKREPSNGDSSGSSHSRIGFSRVTVLRRVEATVPMKDFADAAAIVADRLHSLPKTVGPDGRPSAFSISSTSRAP